MLGHHPKMGEIKMTRATRKVNPNWEDKDYGYVKIDTYQEGLTHTYTRRGIPSFNDDAAWRIEYLTQQLLEYARVKQVCLCGTTHYECDEERGGESCRQCLEMSAEEWFPLNFEP